MRQKYTIFRRDENILTIILLRRSRPQPYYPDPQGDIMNADGLKNMANRKQGMAIYKGRQKIRPEGMYAVNYTDTTTG